MKKQLIALAIAGSLATPILAHAAPTVYGKLHLSYGSVEEKSGGVTTTDNWQLRSHASRVGVKGDHDMGNGLEAIYKFEWQVDYEQGADAGLDRRNMYAGLKGNWGEVRFGRHDTPLKMAQGKFDLFGDTDADLKNAGDQDGENRLDNVLAYLGKSGNIQYAIALIPGEGDGTTTGDGPADTISASIAYEDGPLYVALAQDSHDDTAGQSENSMTRLIGTYKMGGSQLGLMYQTGVEGATTTGQEEDWLGVSFKTGIGARNSFKAQYITVEDNETVQREGTLMAVGVDHKFNKQASGYLMYSNLEEELGGTTDVENSFLGAGLVLKF